MPIHVETKHVHHVCVFGETFDIHMHTKIKKNWHAILNNLMEIEKKKMVKKNIIIIRANLREGRHLG